MEKQKILVKIKPNTEQKSTINKHIECNNFVYNFFLSMKQYKYFSSNKTLSLFDTYKELTKLKNKDDFKYLSELSCQSLQCTLRQLDYDFKMLFTKKNENFIPKVRLYGSNNSYWLNNVNNTLRIEDKKLIVPKVKNGINIVEELKQKELKYAKIIKNDKDEYFAEISYK